MQEGNKYFLSVNSKFIIIEYENIKMFKYN